MASSTRAVSISCAAVLLLALWGAMAWQEPSAMRCRELDTDSCREGQGDPNTEVKFDFSPFVIQYCSGRVQRLIVDTFVPPSVDESTGVASRDVVIDQTTGVSVRLYRASGAAGGRLPVLMFIHGGAFVIESAFSTLYHNYINALVAKAGVIAVSVEYRLAPEHPLPAAYDDSWAALQWVLADARGCAGADPWLSKHADVSRLILAGDSAGGNIAHNLAMRAGSWQGLEDGGGARIRGMALLDPYFIGSDAGPEWQRPWCFISAGRYPPDHPHVNPMAMPAAAWRWLGTDRVLVTVSGLDSLGPWQRAYFDALQGSEWRGEAQLYVTPGEDHTFFLRNLTSPNSAMHMATLATFINN